MSTVRKLIIRLNQEVTEVVSKVANNATTAVCERMLPHVADMALGVVQFNEKVTAVVGAVKKPLTAIGSLFYGARSVISGGKLAVAGILAQAPLASASNYGQINLEDENGKFLAVIGINYFSFNVSSSCNATIASSDVGSFRDDFPRSSICTASAHPIIHRPACEIFAVALTATSEEKPWNIFNSTVVKCIKELAEMQKTCDKLELACEKRKAFDIIRIALFCGATAAILGYAGYNCYKKKYNSRARMWADRPESLIDETQNDNLELGSRPSDFPYESVTEARDDSRASKLALSTR